MIHDKKPNEHINRIVVIGKTPLSNPNMYDTMGNFFMINDDEVWHDYSYNLNSLKEEYPHAETIRIIQFYSYKNKDKATHAFYIKRLLFH